MMKLGTSNVGGIATSRQTMELIEHVRAGQIQGASVRTSGTSLPNIHFKNRFSVVKLTRPHAGGIYSIDHSAHTITLNKDYVILGSSHATNPGTDGRTVVTVTGTIDEPTYVYAYGTTNPLSINIFPTSISEFPCPADNQWRRALHEVYIYEGAVVVLILHLGIIDLTTYSA